ncbi:hypothetical protein [Bradyrhizobium cenepequi]|nr:hypothetical protein [Bradyrhizobium cenepequi]
MARPFNVFPDAPGAMLKRIYLAQARLEAVLLPDLAATVGVG